MKIWYRTFVYRYPNNEEMINNREKAAAFSNAVNEKGKVINITEMTKDNYFSITVWYKAERKIKWNN